MKATIDLPDTLFREAKIRAAREGITMRVIVIRALEQEFYAPKTPRAPRRAAFPLVSLGDDVVMPSLSNDEIDDLLG